MEHQEQTIKETGGNILKGAPNVRYRTFPLKVYVFKMWPSTGCATVKVVETLDAWPWRKQVLQILLLTSGLVSHIFTPLAPWPL